MAEWHPAFEEYCETIFELDEDDVRVVQARIAERLGVSRPSVSEMIKRLDLEGYVDIDDHVIELTAEGQALAERVIKLYSYVEDVVLDPFMGSGSTGVAAAQNGRHYVGFEISAEYCRLANERIVAAQQPTPTAPTD